MTKRIISMLAALALLSGMASGCGNHENADNAANKKPHDPA